MYMYLPVQEPMSQFFFNKRKISVFNLAAHSSLTKEAYNAVWSEGTAGVTERSDSRRILTPGSFFYVEM
jgi:hypothetical protein